MKQITIIYDKYLADDMTVTIGGIQTYISDLSTVIKDMGIIVRIIQFADKDFEYDLCAKIHVSGYHIDAKKESDRYQKLYDKAVLSSGNSALIIFATDVIIPKRVKSNAIAIQHGIFWDIPRDSKHRLIVQVLGRAYAAYKIVKRIQLMKAVVCVDYNFLNWYRTQVGKTVDYIQVIPNYAKISKAYNKPDKVVNIIFARRLYDYRGTRVFTEAIKRILNEGFDVRVTIAGTGPDKGWMKEQISRFPQVEFIQYQSNESLDIHKDKHIAVVPTIGSEGTSLSLLEAMASKCAVICTNVGGMTNIVTDGYNGLMINPNEDDLYQALKRLVEDHELRNALSERAFDTVVNAFSYEKWENKWKRVIEECLYE